MKKNKIDVVLFHLGFILFALCLLVALRHTGLKGWKGVGLFLAALVSTIALHHLLWSRWTLHPWRQRADQQGRWRAAFGAEQAPLIDRYLDLFCEDFGFPRRYKYRLAPDDDFRAYYLRDYAGAIADCMETEHFMLHLEEKYGVRLDVPDLRDGVTLGHLLQRILARQVAEAAPAPNAPDAPAGAPPSPVKAST